VIAGLALVESLTTAIVIVGITGGLLFACSKKKLLFVILIVIGAVAAFILVQYVKGQDTSSGNFRMRRVYEWVHLKDADNDGQVKQGLYALASGGLFGKGLGQSLQKLGFVPEAQNDMIFSIICEELGLFGAVCLILMFMFMIYRFLVIAENAPDLFGSMLVVGIMAHISIQVILNIAVVTNVIPNTGVTLPFISYGQSSLLSLSIGIGILLNVSIHRTRY
jgi:cell division protein FtsW